MAGMFYSLKETAEKLGIAEEDVKQLATDGKLREFRDGSNLLFKIEEVESLLSDIPSDDAEMDLDLELEPEVAESEPEPQPDVDEVLELEPVEEEAFETEPEELPLALDETTAEETEPDLEMAAQADTASELDLAPDLEETADVSAEFSEDDILSDMGSLEEPVAEIGDDEESEISLAPETGMMGADSDITDMDTALTGEGINVLGETDADFDVTDDSLAETVGPAGTSTEASLEEIEDDVNLDSFGSGSGLLDLSLQADDTSLGGILDEIYAADGDEPATGGESDMLDDMTAEADHVTPEEDLAVPEPMVAMPTVAPAFADAAPDTQSNMLGMLLFLPLLALLYTAIVTVAAFKGVMPSVLESIQGMIWYLMGGAIVVAVGISVASFVVGGEKKPRAPKAKKAKKEKAPKAKKAKKEKAPKTEKPKKEKKPLFGKKKKG